MNVHKFGFSKLLDSDVFLYGISNENNMKVNILSLGAAIQSVYLPWSRNDESTESINIVLGFSDVEGYEINDCYLGVAVGRVAGRINNGKFYIDGKKCEVTKNNGGHCLHGGSIGISKKIWSLVSHTTNSVSLKCVSSHGDDGFPGDMEIGITYTVTSDNSIAIQYEAAVDHYDCPVNLTNHSYFNLSGIDNVQNGIKDHVIKINSSQTLELDSNLLPTGKIVKLPTFMDLRNNKEPLRKQLENVGGTPKGFDNYYIFDHIGLENCQAIVSDGITKMTLFTDQNGVQFYTANFFDNVKCSPNIIHHQHGALCLEAQNYPDAINHQEFPSILLKPKEKYSQRTIYKFEKFKS